MCEEADAAPCGADCTSKKGAHAEGAFGEEVEFGNGRCEEGFVARNGEEREEEGEEFGHWGEGAEVEG